MFHKRDKAYYEEELERAKKDKELFDKRAEVEDVKRSMRRWVPPTTTKLIMAYIFINCTAVEVYSMAVMWYLANLDALYALITAVVTESLSFAVYCAKAYNETKQEELIKLERDRDGLNGMPKDIEESTADSDEAVG